MSHAQGMAWLHYSHQYRRRFGSPVPDWACVFDVPRKLGLVRVALRLGWQLPETVLVRDEFQGGRWSVWE